MVILEVLPPGGITYTSFNPNILKPSNSIEIAFRSDGTIQGAFRLSSETMRNLGNRQGKLHRNFSTARIFPIENLEKPWETLGYLILKVSQGFHEEIFLW